MNSKKDSEIQETFHNTKFKWYTIFYHISTPIITYKFNIDMQKQTIK